MRTLDSSFTVEIRGAAPPDGARRSLIASGVGNVLEWYDWTIYAVLAPFIAAALFNPADPTSALLSTLAVFAVGFVARPLGGFLFGMLADRIGRKNVLVVTMAMTAVGSLAIGCIPDYATLGGWASLLLVVIRLGQGLAHGGEAATTYTYVSEIAPAARRGLWGSSVHVCVVLGSMLSYAVTSSLTGSLGTTAMGEWGWRIPFVLGALLALYALVLRRTMVESVHGVHSVDVADGADAANELPAVWSRGRILRSVVQLVFLVNGITAAIYFWVSSATTYAITQKGVEPGRAFLALLAAEVLFVIALPFWGWVSDRVGRRPVIVTGALVLAALELPLSALIGGSAWTLFGTAAVAVVVLAAAAGPSTAILSEAVPTRHRAVVIGTAGSLAVAVFGGTAPYLSTLLASLGVGWTFHFYVILLLVGTAIATLTLPENKGIALKDVR